MANEHVNLGIKESKEKHCMIWKRARKYRTDTLGRAIRQNVAEAVVTVIA